MSFLFINKILHLNNLKIKAAINAKISLFVICVEAIIYLLLYNLHDCTFSSLSHELFCISLLIFHKLLCWLLCKIARIPLVIVKPHKLYKVIFMALYYVFISMSIFTVKVCLKIPCGVAFYFVETIQLIQGENQVSGFYIVWVSTVKNIRTDYRFCCFNINKLSCYLIFREGSCTTDLMVLYLDAG